MMTPPPHTMEQAPMARFHAPVRAQNTNEPAHRATRCRRRRGSPSTNCSAARAWAARPGPAPTTISAGGDGGAVSWTPCVFAGCSSSGSALASTTAGARYSTTACAADVEVGFQCSLAVQWSNARSSAARGSASARASRTMPPWYSGGRADLPLRRLGHLGFAEKRRRCVLVAVVRRLPRLQATSTHRSLRGAERRY